MPPSLAEQEAFLTNPTSQALDEVIDRLLASPSYGERWARHWLDLVRFAETNGYERDAEKPSVWRYRDYVIRAFNDDKPYDRFLLEQLAGDELLDATPETMIATSYCRLGPWDDEPADPKEDRFDQLEDMVSTTSLAFLGLTLGCARCHNHKFEPLSQLDYYRMVAVFNPLQRPQPGRADIDLPAIPPAVRSRQLRTTAVWLAGLGASPASSFNALALSAQPRFEPVPRGYFLVESPSGPVATHILLRGKATRPGAEVGPGVPTVLVSAQPTFPKPAPYSSLRRLALARWIASPENPLTARVIVNRVWQFHFGEGLVRTASDFGVMGEPPTHPELLDWLADWFVKEGWSIKKLHRLILSSNTWRMSKVWNPSYGAIDPENRLLWRVHYRRLDVEAIRDSVLAITDRLSHRMYGPSMYPEVPKEALDGHSDPDKIWKPFDEKDASRRTVYAFVKRSMVVPLLEVLDLCDTTRSSAKRTITTVAPQALTLFNGDFINRQSGYLADRLLREAGSDSGKQVERAYLLALGRLPSAAEMDAMKQFLTKENVSGQTSRLDRAALREMCRVIFNLNEFAYPD
jgi:hypothetical protein